jgi:hypothetical protein
MFHLNYFYVSLVMKLNKINSSNLLVLSLMNSDLGEKNSWQLYANEFLIQPDQFIQINIHFKPIRDSNSALYSR